MKNRPGTFLLSMVFGDTIGVHALPPSPRPFRSPRCPTGARSVYNAPVAGGKSSSSVWGMDFQPAVGKTVGINLRNAARSDVIFRGSRIQEPVMTACSGARSIEMDSRPPPVGRNLQDRRPLSPRCVISIFSGVGHWRQRSHPQIRPPDRSSDGVLRVEKRHQPRPGFTNLQAELSRQIVAESRGPIFGIDSPPVATTSAGARNSCSATVATDSSVRATLWIAVLGNS